MKKETAYVWFMFSLSFAIISLLCAIPFFLMWYIDYEMIKIFFRINIVISFLSAIEAYLHLENTNDLRKD